MGLRVDAGRGVEGTSLGCDVVAGVDAGAGAGAGAEAEAGAVVAAAVGAVVEAVPEVDDDDSCCCDCLSPDGRLEYTRPPSPRLLLFCLYSDESLRTNIHSPRPPRPPREPPRVVCLPRTGLSPPLTCSDLTAAPELALALALAERCS